MPASDELNQIGISAIKFEGSANNFLFLTDVFVAIAVVVAEALCYLKTNTDAYKEGDYQ